jgi:hypothetical protein
MNRSTRIALWEEHLRSQGVKAWYSGRESQDNSPIQEPLLKRIDPTVSLEVGDRLAFGSVDDGYCLVRITKIIDPDPQGTYHVRSFAVEPVVR